MKIILFGGTGMVGRGVLQACLKDDSVERVLAIGRNRIPVEHPKLEQIEHKDLFDYTAIRDKMRGFDACFFTLGVSSAGMKEADYARITYDGTMAAAHVLAELNPQMTFIYVSGQSTDSSEKGSAMWARVKGKTENDLMKLPFKAVYAFRPGAMMPLRGVWSRTPLYNVLYVLLFPVFFVASVVVPSKVFSVELVGRAMINAVRKGGPSRTMEVADIHALG
jgi:uncharacterized protein YbjT (DUF2867 family)